MDSKIIVFELNEVPWQVIDAFIERHPTSAFARARASAGAINTHLPDTGQKHPKISWQTFHRGVPDHVHGIREYNQVNSQGQRLFPAIWDLARSAGKTVGCGASIGSWPLPENQEGIDFWFADPFAPTPDSIPEHINAFQEFNTLAVARSSRNVRSGGVPKNIVYQFVRQIPRLGITPTTLVRTVEQLVMERIKPARSVRRRNIQAMLSFDVAIRHWEQTQPHLATIFANHVAAAMHRYWAAAFPDDYQNNNMPLDWRNTYADEIDAAMQVADRMLARLLLASEKSGETSILVIGSMGQAAIEHEPITSQLVIQDMSAFLSALGIDPHTVEQRPGMAPEYVLAFEDTQSQKRFAEACQSMDINGQQPYMKPVSDTECAVLVDQYNVSFDAVSLDGVMKPLSDVGLNIEPIDDMTGSTAQHVAEGMGMILRAGHDLSKLKQADEALDLCSVTASLLAALGVTVPDYMPEPYPPLVKALRTQPPLKAVELSSDGPASDDETVPGPGKRPTDNTNTKLTTVC